MPTETFTTDTNWTVPNGVQSVNVDLQGQKGGNGRNSFQDGGDGGRVAGTMSVDPGQTLYIRFPNDGASNEYGGSGGDSCDIRVGGTSLSDRAAVAAGGGGSGEGTGAGGQGGADTGEAGYGGTGGGGGTQTSGGAAGDGSAQAGSFGQGGQGGTDSYFSENGGNGGGGWYGGGGGGDGDGSSSSGGGGSNYDDGLDTVSANTRGGSTEGTNGGVIEIEYQQQPAAPNNVSPTVNGDDEISLSWDTDTSAGSPDDFDVQISRDGASFTSPSGGASNVSADGSGNYTVTYTPSSDNSYDSQVGIDSSFQFRVRANNGAGSSDWTSSGTVYTTPIPPHNPSVSRPNADTIELSITLNTDILHFIRVQYRVDTGDGYVSWDDFDNITSGEQTTGTWSKGSTITREYSVGSSYQYGHTLQSDARYQFRLRMGHNNGPTLKWSDWVYADYGNEGNVYFEDYFESGDLSSWDATNLQGEWGVYDSSFVDGNASSDDQTSNDRVHPVTGPDQGTYYLFGDGDGYVQKNLGDLSAETDVVVKCAMATGSMDSDAESIGLEWYDGAAWQDLERFSHEYNRQEWVEVVALVPSSWLSADNRLRLDGIGGSGDYAAWDRVVVSDILHEYTTPAVPSGITLDTSVDREITASWTDNSSFETAFDTDYQRASASSWSNHANIDGTQTTVPGLLDGEEYAIRTRAFIGQDRNGSLSQNWNSSFISSSAVTTLPAPTGLSVDAITATSADLTWTDNHNYGDTEFQFKQSDATSWTTFSTLSRGTQTETLTGLLNGEQYDSRVVAVTEHTTTEDQ